MSETRQRHPTVRYIALLSVGFAGLCLPNLMHYSAGSGFFTAIWILTFLRLTDRFSSGLQTGGTLAVFLAGFFLKYFTAVNFEWQYAVIFLLMGLIQFGIFRGYSRIIRKHNGFIATLIFPALWMAVYLVAMLVRFPSMFRVDMMFADMNVLLQTESFLGSFGLSFVLLWIFALFSFAIGNRRGVPALVGVLLYIAMLAFGAVYLAPNVTESGTVRVALSTGPYVGDYLHYISYPMARHLESMRRCTAEAAAQGAEIIAFNEETYEIDDAEEEAFLAECCLAAHESDIHMLVGLDLRDTDGSENGKSVNKAVWISRDGEILGSYVKTMIIPIMEYDYVKGEGKIPSHVISVGDREIRISYLICYDSNFPLFVNNIDNDTDILFLPSWDWAAVTEQHAMLCRTLAVENRVSVVKPTYDGINIAVRPDGTVIDSFSTDESGYEQIRIMDIPVGEAEMVAERNHGKAYYIYNIISVEILSIIVCLILLYGNIFKNSERRIRNRLYSLAVIICIAGLGADATSWVFDGCERLETMLYVCTLLSMSLIFILDSVFVCFITAYIREKKSISTVIPRIFVVFSLIAAGATAVFSESGGLFSFENGVYREGPMYGVYIIVNLICAVICLAINLSQLKFMDRDNHIASMTYIIFPCAAGIINIFDETFSYAYPAVMLSLCVLYIMIQSEREDRLEKAGFFSYQLARHDALTGLPNRLAYEEKLKKMAHAEGNAAVLFTDVNGLKLTNDSCGHEAGDQLLIRYTDLLCRCFRREEIFRISGDEFTALLDNIDEEALRARMERFRKALNESDIPMASTGLAFGNSRDIGKLIKAAETEMYADKEAFYRCHPEMRK